ncbi:MAG: RagB/SusD family nutrient uptake outer membrane protein [Candidatus Saccharimonadaceae bacterium]
MKKIIIYLFISLLVYTSCDIDRFPYGSMSSDAIVADPDGSLESLLNGSYAQLKGWSDVMHRCGEYAGDNMMIRGTSTDAFYEFISYSRTPNNYRLQSFWDGSYKVIAQTSNLIKMVDEGTSVERDNQIGEAYFLRGMMYFYLCRAYGRPYYQSPDSNLGVPIVNGTPEDMENLDLPDRATVKQTYEQAIKDLEKSIELFSINNGPIFGSANAAKALLSRIYLYMSGTYEAPNTEFANLAIKYADEVIASPDYSLLPRAEFMNYNRKTPENNKETIFAIKRVASEFSGDDHYYGVGGMYATIGGMGWGEMYASAKYIDLLNETGRNDWYKNKIVDARAAFIEPQYEEDAENVFRFIKNVYPLTKGASASTQTNYNYVQGKIITKGSDLYCIENVISYQYDGNKIVPRKDAEGKSITKDVEYKLTPVSVEEGTYKIESYNTFIDIEPINITVRGVIDNRMKLNRVYPMFYITKSSREGEESHLHSPVITRLGEVYLNKAEAAAKVGNYAVALSALNLIRERSLPGEGYASLNATNASERIDKERQLELAYQAERSYDVFRNGKSLTRMYPGPHFAMEVVKATDYRVVYYIPQDAINSYPGKLTQNPTN